MSDIGFRVRFCNYTHGENNVQYQTTFNLITIFVMSILCYTASVSVKKGLLPSPPCTNTDDNKYGHGQERLQAALAVHFNCFFAWTGIWTHTRLKMISVILAIGHREPARKGLCTYQFVYSWHISRRGYLGSILYLCVE